MPKELEWDTERVEYLEKLYARSKAGRVSLSNWEKGFVWGFIEDARAFRGFSDKQRAVIGKLHRKYE